MVKLFSSRLEPLDEWLLVRIPETASAGQNGKPLLLAERTETGKMKVVQGGPTKRNHGIVVAVGPGARANNTGERIPIDERIVPGATVIFPGKVAFQPEDFAKEMEEEGVWYVPASTVVAVLHPEGVVTRRAVQPA